MPASGNNIAVSCSQSFTSLYQPRIPACNPTPDLLQGVLGAPVVSCGAHGTASGPNTKRQISLAKSEAIQVEGRVVAALPNATFRVSVSVGDSEHEILAYVSGLSLAVLTIMKHERLCFTRALRVVWIGEGISIGIMDCRHHGA